MLNDYKIEVYGVMAEELHKQRRIDELGRIVLPKEFCDSLGWRVGDCLTIRDNSSGVVLSRTLKGHGVKIEELRLIKLSEECRGILNVPLGGLLLIQLDTDNRQLILKVPIPKEV